ncbi:hypothetical protein [Bradyrhizobium erythrophlei]|uniref:Uncharacterized protein n=1 Tax=Bradyrhizobium erythrophlei TaxID=1437360 RepID=A0A1M5SIQ6_9BRAD|nr:hypothetical protein [Bradyrhizobium erythrophlei]SHH37783.1 hypothetical protein SAMN05443248_4605 [Bradyrhizobium erythrophlei]
MSPTYFAFHMARLDDDLKAARLAGNVPQQQGLLAQRMLLLRAMYGQRLAWRASPGSPLVRPAAAGSRVPVDRRQRMGESPSPARQTEKAARGEAGGQIAG